MNKTLKTLYDTDQKDRENIPMPGKRGSKGRMDWVAIRDKERRNRVEEILKTKKNLEAIDYYHAAMVFQHSQSKQKHAVTLAKKSMDMGYEDAKWLYAKAYDRALLESGKKQKYGTQFAFLKNGKLIVRPYDKRTSDKTRAKFNVQTIKKRLKELNKRKNEDTMAKKPRHRVTTR